MPDLTGPTYVFAYGSLVGSRACGAVAATLTGHRREWGVAMDNRVAIPGYKRYLDPQTAVPPAVFVAFLDLAHVPSATVDGVCLPVADGAVLAALDRRERNYDRVDVTGRLEGAPPGTVWAYRGSAAGRARVREGAATGSLVVARAYADAVEAAFATFGDAALARLRATTAPPPGPVLDLVREELPLSPRP